MPEFIIIKSKGDPQPHCAVPFIAESAAEIILLLEESAPRASMREKTIAVFAERPVSANGEPSKRAQKAAMWKARLETLGTARGARAEFCRRYGCQESGLNYWLKRFPRT